MYSWATGIGRQAFWAYDPQPTFCRYPSRERSRSLDAEDMDKKRKEKKSSSQSVLTRHDQVRCRAVGEAAAARRGPRHIKEMKPHISLELFWLCANPRYFVSCLLI